MEIEETTKHTVEIRNEHVSDQTAAADFAFDNTYARELDGFYVDWKATQVRSPRLVKFNRELAEELGLDGDALDSDRGARIFAGNAQPEGAIPLAQAYAGHQFGGFVPQLGDGRALLLGEIIDRHGRPSRYSAQRLRPHAIFTRR